MQFQETLINNRNQRMKYTTRQSDLLNDGTIFHGIGISGTTLEKFALILV
jgi:hypothetical protein